MSHEEEIAQQIQDLNDLNIGDEEDIEIDSDDSDAEQMRKLISYD